MSTGHQILGFDVISTLGYGAHSTIFSVRDPKDDSMYALKRVIKETPEDQRFVDQAVLEHEVGSQLDHPTLRKSLKLIRQRDTLLRTVEVLVLMELIEGETLEKSKPSDLVDLCELCQQLADGLAAMHKGGYAHGDIKPNNIIITPRGQAKIIDLGQSCPIGTIKQRIQGTPDYIAPEQVLRRAIRPETDVFNLGATMYWLLTDSHVPTMIPKRQLRGKAKKKRDRIREPRDINPEIPPALSRLVLSCVRGDPRKRPDTMAEVRDRLGLALLQLRRGDGADEGASEEVDQQPAN